MYLNQVQQSFDKKFYDQDIRGSIAHVTMLAKQGILTDEEKEKIIEGLEGIRSDVENGTLEITDKYEDIHSFVEANLIDRIGDAGKKLHTGRSRNDQVALDMKLYVRDEIDETDKELKDLLLARFDKKPAGNELANNRCPRRFSADTSHILKLFFQIIIFNVFMNFLHRLEKG